MLPETSPSLRRWWIDPSTVLAAISNTAYEGEIKNQGDTVHIRTKPTITINDYLADGLTPLHLELRLH